MANRYCQMCGGFHKFTTAPCPNYDLGPPLDLTFEPTPITRPLTGSSALAVEVGALRDRIAELEAALATAVEQQQRARDALREVEWGPAPHGWGSTCSWCLHAKRNGHAPDCRVSSVLAAAAPIEPTNTPTETEATSGEGEG